LKHVPLCREEEGVGICAGAYLAGKKPALLMQNAGLLNSCNGLTTTCLQFQIPLLLLIYYAGDFGDRGFATVGSVTEPVLEALGIRTYVLRRVDEVEETLRGAQILAEDSRRPVAVLLTKSVLGGV
jgi:sulfopyruvate decarboxylase subunit alpha